jgi:hypothetical protein
MKKNFLKHKGFYKYPITLALDAVFFGGINAYKVKQIFLVFAFALLMFNFYLLVYSVTSLIRLHGDPIKRNRSFSIYSALLLGMLVALESIGSLSSKDIFWALLFGVIAYIYIGYVNISKRNTTKS